VPTMSAFMFGATPTQRLQWRQSGSPDHRQSQMSGGPSQPDDDLGCGFSPWRLLSLPGCERSRLLPWHCHAFAGTVGRLSGGG
jgi:hypothetical protein